MYRIQVLLPILMQDVPQQKGVHNFLTCKNDGFSSKYQLGMQTCMFAVLFVCAMLWWRENNDVQNHCGQHRLSTWGYSWWVEGNSSSRTVQACLSMTEQPRAWRQFITWVTLLRSFSLHFLSSGSFPISFQHALGNRFWRLLSFSLQ